MPIPSEFYHLQTRATRQYTRVPTGNLDVGQLIVSKPVWILPASLQLGPKKLILNDWTLSDWTPKKTQAVQAMFSNLIGQGFTLYCYWEGSLLPLTRDNLYLLNDAMFRVRIGLNAPQDVLDKAAKQYRLARDSIFILDDYWLSYLIADEQERPPRSLRVSHYFALNDDEGLRLPEIMEQAFPPLEYIIDDMMEARTAIHDQVFAILDHDFPLAQRISEHSVVYIGEHEEQGFLSDHPDQSKIVELRSESEDPFQFLLPGSLPGLEILEIQHSEEQLARFAVAAPQVRTLFINDWQDVCGFDGLKPFTQVSNLAISGSHFELGDLYALLHFCATRLPNLNMLALTNCVITGNEASTGLVADFGNLDALTRLDLSLSMMDMSVMNSLLARTPNVRHLLIGGRGEENYSESPRMNELNVETLAQLESLKLTSCPLSGEEFNNLCKRLSRPSRLILKKLSLKFLSEETLNTSMSTLAELVLEHCDIYPMELQAIRSLCPNITTLELINPRNMFADFSLAIPPLAKLNTVYLNDSQNRKQINSELMTSLLNPSDFPMMSCILLRDCYDISVASIEESQADYPDIRILDSHPGMTEAKLQDIAHTPRPVNSRHNIKKFINIKPTSRDFQFAFRRKQHTKNQTMIIEKLSQFLTVQQKFCHIIPKLQDGICHALCCLFQALSAQEWTAFIESVYAWDGRKSSLHPALVSEFKRLTRFVLDHQLNQSRQSINLYAGEHLPQILVANKADDQYLLRNPWHAITARPNADNSWQSYDPNADEGQITLPDKTALLKEIKERLGNLVSVHIKLDGDININAGVSDPDTFLKEGGLLAITQVFNGPKLITGIAQHDFSADALKGILLRNRAGKPAWVCGLRNTLTAQFTDQVLQQFMDQWQGDAEEMLQRSIKLLGLQEKQDCMTHILNLGPSPHRELLIETIRNASNKYAFEEALQTWHKERPSVSGLPAYCQQSLQPGPNKKRLIEVDSTQSLNALRLALEKHCQNTQRPVFYVHSPDDLICSTPFVERNGSQGIKRKGPGGPLHDFLSSHHGKPPPVLLVNYETFSAEDLAKFNQLIDKQRQADGTALPEDTLLIGLFNSKKPNCYEGEDFYSRFDQIESCPISSTNLRQSLPNLPPTEAPQDGQVINLFNSPNWKDKLLGHWVLDGNSLRFEEGELAKLSSNQIDIWNGPWEDPAFELFWQTACYPGRTHFPGSNIPIPQGMQPVRKSGYDLEALSLHLSLVDLPDDEGCAILNPHRLNRFLPHYEYQAADLSVRPKPGLIEQAAGGVLPVYLSSAVGLDDWARLLTECQQYEVTLQVSRAPGVQLPVELGFAANDLDLTLTDWGNRQPAATELIISTDRDVTLTQLTEGQSDWMIIDVSELNPADLLGSLDGKLNEETLEFEFHKTPSLLRQALASGKRIILSGHFSNELSDSLVSLLRKRLNNSAAPGQLILLPDNPDHMTCIDPVVHWVNAEEKRQCLGDLDPRLESFVAEEPLCHLKARQRLLRAFPDTEDSSKAWAGMLHTPGNIAPLAALDPSSSAAESHAFLQARNHDVNRMLDHAPYVLLTGPSGVGKTTFARETWGEQLYQGKDAIKAWASNRGKYRKHLLLDEATLDASDWTMLEGLFNNPPGILYQGVFYPLDEGHKVIATGNAVSYGDERKLATFFQRHGNALVFEPLPTAVLYEQTLKPIFCDLPYDEQTVGELSGIFLEVYRFLVACSTDDVLISPRELEMMALLTISYCKNHPDANPREVAQHFAFRLAINLVPDKQKNAFQQQFTPDNPLPITVSSREEDEFLLTPTRMPAAQLLDDLLSLRQFRMHQATNDQQRYGGLGGLIFEGLSSVGKSGLIYHSLQAQGFQFMTMQSPPTDNENTVYVIPAGMPLDEKTALLLKAFHEGALVLIEEINSAPMLESLLNHLLMGRTPEGNKPDKPGFMLIASQNPISMSGRRAASTAIQRRMVTEVLPPYPRDETMDILQHEQLNYRTAKDMVKALEKNQARAKREKLSPAPTFRDALRLAKRYIGSLLNRHKHGRMQPSSSSSRPPPTKTLSPARFFSGKKERDFVQDNNLEAQTPSKMSRK